MEPRIKGCNYNYCSVIMFYFQTTSLSDLIRNAVVVECHVCMTRLRVQVMKGRLMW